MSLFGKKQQEAVLRAFSGKDRYRFLRAVGEGGISTVGSFYDARLNRVVALKELKAEHVDSEELTRFFINEAKLLGYLDHPGVIPVFDTFLGPDKRPCYTMKLFQGMSLDELQASYAGAQGTPMPLPRALEILVKLSQTLAYVHDKGVLHLDVKPSNIMVGTYGEVMLLDWGSARLFKTDRFYEHLGQHTSDTELAYFEQEREDLVLGTPRYMSPEQGECGREKLTCASDVFSAGIVCYELLTSRHPFPAEKPRELADQISLMDPASPHALNHEVPRMLSDICMRMLRKRPADRYPDFHAVLSDLSSFRGVGEAFPQRDYAHGEILFNEGDPGDFACLILAGQVEILKWTGEAEPRVIALAGVGEVIGELAIISGLPRSAGARALGATRVRILSKPDIERELEKLSPWVSKMITGLSGRFLELRDRLLELERRMPIGGSP